MPHLSIEAWSYIGYINTAVLAIVILPYIFRDVPSPKVEVTQPGLIEVGFIACVIVLGLVLRLFFMEEFEAGKLTSDEAWMSIYYTANIVGGEPVRTGATKIVFSLVFDLWHHLVPFTASWSRGLSALLGILGILAVYFWAAASFGIRIALWTAALSCVSLYGIYFSKLSLEIIWALVIPPLVLLLVGKKWNRFSGVSFFFAGCVAAAGMFTYPGTILVFVALALGYGVAWFLQRIVLERFGGWPIVSIVSIKYWVCFFLGFITVMAFGVYLHFRVYGVNGDALFFGGGNPTAQWFQIVSNLKAVLIDLFNEGRSWYLPYRGTPFVEVFVWPIALLGARVAWVSRSTWTVRGLIFAIPLIIILSAMTGAYPGMRRAAGVLPFLYLFASIGMVYILGSRCNSENEVKQGRSAAHCTYNVFLRYAAVITVVIGIGHLIYYQFTLGRNYTSFNFGTGFVLEPFEYEELMEVLQEKDIVIDFPEGKEYFDKLFYKHYPSLARRYRWGYKSDHNVHFIGDRNDPFIRNLNQRDNWILAGWDPVRIYQISQDFGLCVNLKRFDSYESIPFVAYSFPLSDGNEGGSCQGPEELGFDINNSIMLGYRYSEEKVRHLFECEGPNCNPSREDFIYTRGGVVSFSLRIPEKWTTNAGHELKIHVLNGQRNRESRVYVDSEYLGLLNLDVVDEVGIVRYRLQPEKYRKGAIVRISIKPSDDPEKLGWDIDQASIVETGQ